MNKIPLSTRVLLIGAVCLIAGIAATVKFSALDPTTKVDGDDYFPLIHDATNASVTMDALAANLATNSAIGIAGKVDENLGVLTNATLWGNTTNPVTTATVGVMYKGVDRFLHNYAEAGSIGINTFLGVEAGNLTLGTGGGATSLGSYNTGIGSQSLRYLTTGFNNTGTGENTLAVNTVGANNTANGAGSMISNTNGGKNFAGGVQSLYYNLQGNENVAIGYFAGVTETAANANKFGSQNVWIGTEAGPGGTNQISNSIHIGSQAHGTNSNEVVIGNASITQTLLKGNVGIGTLAPTEGLDLGTKNIRLRDNHWAGESQYNSYGLNASGVPVLNGGTDVYINIDSDDSATTQAFIIGKDRLSTTGGAELMKLTETGLLGIGTNAPAARLHVTGTGAVPLLWQFGTTARPSLSTLNTNGLHTVAYGTLYSSNSLALPSAAIIGVGGYWVGNSNGVLVTLYSIDALATVMKVLAP